MERPIDIGSTSQDRRTDDSLSPGYRIYGARLALWWERIWFCLWPALCVVATFLIVSLFSLLPTLNGWLHLLILIGFGLAFAYAIGWLIPGLRRPSRKEAIRRLEQVNALEHRPLTRIEDKLATGNTDPEAAALWELYRRRTASELGKLRIGAPHPNIVAKDPFALRAILALLLMVALSSAGRMRRSDSARGDAILSGFDFGEGVTVTLSLRRRPTPHARRCSWNIGPGRRHGGSTTQAAPAEISIFPPAASCWRSFRACRKRRR